MNNDNIASQNPTLAIRIEKWVPGVTAIRNYNRAWLAKDLVAGIILCALLVPQGMAYAELAGLPAITGLYTTIVCLFAYAAVGPSPFLVLGPDSSLGPMIAAAILPLAAGDETYAIALAGMLWSKQLFLYDVNRWLKEHGIQPLKAIQPSIRNDHWGTWLTPMRSQCRTSGNIPG